MAGSHSISNTRKRPRNGDKEFLGHKGNLNGEDIVDIICKEPATAAFLSRHMYSFFVADEAPVPEWPYKPPRDPDAINALSKVYFESGYDIAEMLKGFCSIQSFSKLKKHDISE
ncbi:MAG: hypothetical protein Ct9H300mP19_13370 [Dehalococcoidia bacterium]|nr:MAG: hypothetical protein Ct9H300mP19_13370 [Dehalococcoidia bacterium]